MIKGVNKQIIEIHDTGCKCFDKVLLFVNRDYSIGDAKVGTEAERLITKYAAGTDVNGKLRQKKQRTRIRWAVYSAGALLSAVIGAAVFEILGNIF